VCVTSFILLDFIYIQYRSLSINRFTGKTYVYKNVAQREDLVTAARVFGQYQTVNQIANLELISHNRCSCYGINRKPRGVGYEFLVLYSRPFAKKST